ICSHIMTLLELPLEVLHLIIGSLYKDESYIFSDLRRRYLEPPNAYRVRSPTLLNLCLVDKKLAMIAREYLYRYFNSVSDRSGLFIRTMVQRPQYREYVRCLKIEPQGTFPSRWKSVTNDSNSDWSAFAYHSILYTAGTVSKCFPPLLMYSDRL